MKLIGFAIGLLFHAAALPIYTAYFVLSCIGDWFIELKPHD